MKVSPRLLSFRVTATTAVRFLSDQTSRSYGTLENIFRYAR